MSDQGRLIFSCSLFDFLTTISMYFFNSFSSNSIGSFDLDFDLEQFVKQYGMTRDLR